MNLISPDNKANRLTISAVAAWLFLLSPVAAASALVLSPEERDWLRAHPVIRYGSDPAAGPYSYVDRGKHEGFAADYMRALESRIGVRFEFRAYEDWTALHDAAKKREIDVVAIMIRSTLDNEHLLFAEPVLTSKAPPVIGIRSDWPRFQSIVSKAQRSFPVTEINVLRQRWLDPPRQSFTGQQLTLIVVTLIAGGLGIALLFTRWAGHKRRGLAREVERGEAAFNAFFDASPAGMAILDRQLRYVRVNDTMARIDGCAREDHLGRSMDQVVPDISSGVVPLLSEVLMTGRSFQGMEISGRAPASPTRNSHWLVSCFPVSMATGRIPFGVGVMMLDISDRKQVELALRDSESRLRKVSDHIPVAVFQFQKAVDGEERFTFLSEGAQRLLLRNPDEVIGNPRLFIEAIHSDDRKSLIRHWESLSRQADVELESQWIGRRNPDIGPECWLQIRATINLPASGLFSISGVILDITGIKNIQRALERSQGDLRRLGAHREGIIEREHQRLAREFHDELGQVLTTARMHLQLLQRNLPKDLTDTRNALREIDSMVEEAYRSVKTIASDLRPAALNLGLAAAVEWIAERILAPAGIKFDISIMPAAEKLEDTYAIALFRVIQESLTNVVRHSAARTVHIALGIHADELHLTVEDDGCGFDPLDVDSTEHFGLMGISERIASLGGTLDLDSAPNSGTRLSVTLLQIPLRVDIATGV